MGVKQLICCLSTAPSPAPVLSPSPSPPPSLAPAPNLRAPDVRFRVLIIGRANAGKTSILQRVCDTTESPVIYRSRPSGTQSQVELKPTIERGLHDIEDELTFTNHSGYVFHDSRGFEAGSADELKTVQEFVARKSQEKRLKDRLHAIWYCIPMENARPSLDLKHFGDICPDKNVPVIAVFTKFDQFKRNIKMQLEDEGLDTETHFETEVESIFDRYYLGGLSEPPPFVRLEKMHKHDQRCTELVEVTANALSRRAVALMLIAVQRDSLELSVKKAVEWTHNILQREDRSTEDVIKACIAAFPPFWYFVSVLSDPYFMILFLLLPSRSARHSLRLLTWPSLCGLQNRGMRGPGATGTSDREGLEEEIILDFTERDTEFDETFNFIFNKLTSFYSNPRLCISTSNVTNHTMIVTVLILEYATILYASPSHPTRENTLDEARSQFISSNTHHAVNRLFLLSPIPYSTQQLTEFLLLHRLR